MKQKQIITALGIIFLGFLLVNGFGLLSVTQFESGFLPFGESVNQITDLVFISFTNPPTTNKVGSLLYDSKYWGINQADQGGFSSGGYEPRNQQFFSGSDLNFVSATPQGGGTDRANPWTYTILTSKETFDQRDFKTTFNSNPDGDSGTTWVFYGSTLVNINLIGDSGEVNVLYHLFNSVENPEDLNVIIHPSVVSDKVSIFVNGILSKVIDYPGEYFLEIIMGNTCGSSGQTRPQCGTHIIMENPSFKQEFGCTIDSNQQFYVIIFKEGDQININKLDNFNKFCLAESPLKIFTNIGSTTETSVLGDLVNGEEFIVPIGQIWSIGYIGEKTMFTTDCEEDEAFNQNEDVCMSRTVFSLTCASDSEFDFDRGICVVETEPSIFNPSNIETHQELQEKSRFRFTHLKNQDTFFNIGEDTFSSNELIYIGSRQGNVNYKDDPFDWVASFSFNGQSFEGNKGDTFELNEFISVDITEVDGFRNDDFLEDFKVEYTFSILPSFLDISYNEGIIVTNNFKTFEGGLIIQTINNIGTTKIDKIEKDILFGENFFEVDITNILEIKARPFINIKTPNFVYSFDTTKAITIDNFDSPNGTPTIKVKDFGKTIAFSVILIISIIGLILLFLFIRRKS